jgi:hypothetical protein
MASLEKKAVNSSGFYFDLCNNKKYFVSFFEFLFWNKFRGNVAAYFKL